MPNEARCPGCGQVLCPECGEHQWACRCEDPVCEDCGEYLDECLCHRNSLRSYGDSPLHYFAGFQRAAGDKPDAPTIGVELEVAGRVRDLRLEGWAIAKHDGSLGEDGFEVCTVPMSIKRHREAWEQSRIHYAEVPNIDGYGLHVHISADLVGMSTAAKLCKLIHSGNHYEMIEGFAGRYEADGWVQFASVYVADSLHGYLPRDHYHAVNFRTSTVEFRMPGATVDVAEILGRAEWPLAMVRFCDLVAYDDVCGDGFCSWLSTVGGNEYPSALWLGKEVGLCV